MSMAGAVEDVVVEVGGFPTAEMLAEASRDGR
jgi:hypothetical protein